MQGPIGSFIDTLAVVVILFGVATSLGIGMQQVNAGLEHFFGLRQSSATQVLLILGITVLATLSVVLGINKGIRRLSEESIITGFGLLLFVLIAGPTFSVLDSWVQNTGRYFQDFLGLPTWAEA